MCGIAGEICSDRQSADIEALKKAQSVLKPRGPDAQGLLEKGHWAFAHTRLSIIDLSDLGHQPMCLDSVGVDLTYNGEIYNYQELRDELSKKGHSFATHSDTEVLGVAYREWGPEFVKRLYGMFAFVLFDRESGDFVFGRDRLGIKPLYINRTSNKLRFASNIKALLQFSGVDSSIDPIALHQYMSLHAIVFEPKTLLRGIEKLPAAHIGILDSSGSWKLKKYWEPSYFLSKEKEGWTEEDWEEAMLQALRSSVTRRLVADVPVGLFLSGGVDSSLIAALISEQAPESLQTFSVGFSGAGGEEGNEFKYSDIVAKRYSTKHHRIEVGEKEVLENLVDCVGAMNEPMVSYDNIGFYLLSKYSSQHTKVVQSGQGADEVFAGYHWYEDLLHSKNFLNDYRHAFLDRDHETLKTQLGPKWAGEDYTSQALEVFSKEVAGLDPVTQALRMDTHRMLVEDPVKRVDSNTMRWSLEARVPFLDHDVVELAAEMPLKFKIQGELKYLLKKIAARFVPKEVLYRPKGYFPVPQLKYLTGPFKDFVMDYVDTPGFRQRGLFNQEYIQNISKDPQKHITKLRGNELWQVATLEIWLKEMNL